MSTIKKFCPQCGVEAKASFNFCGACGQSLNSLTKQVSTKSSQSTFTPFSLIEEDEDDSYLDRIQHLDIRIDKLEIEPQKYNQSLSKQTIGSVAKSPLNPSEIEKKVGPYIDMSKEDFLKSFQQELKDSKPE